MEHIIRNSLIYKEHIIGRIYGTHNRKDHITGRIYGTHNRKDVRNT